MVGSGFTLLFESYAMFLIENEMSVSRVARTLKVTEHRIWRVFNYWIEKAKSNDILTEINSIGVDETSTKKDTIISQFLQIWSSVA